MWCNTKTPLKRGVFVLEILEILSAEFSTRATRSTLFSWTSLIHCKRSAHEFFAVESVDCSFGFFIIFHCDETKTSRLACVSVLKGRSLGDISISGKELHQIFIGDIPRQVSYENFHVRIVCLPLKRPELVPLFAW